MLQFFRYLRFDRGKRGCPKLLSGRYPGRCPGRRLALQHMEQRLTLSATTGAETPVPTLTSSLQEGGFVNVSGLNAQPLYGFNAVAGTIGSDFHPLNQPLDTLVVSSSDVVFILSGDTDFKVVLDLDAGQDFGTIVGQANLSEWGTPRTLPSPSVLPIASPEPEAENSEGGRIDLGSFIGPRLPEPPLEKVFPSRELAALPNEDEGFADSKRAKKSSEIVTNRGRDVAFEVAVLTAPTPGSSSERIVSATSAADAHKLAAESHSTSQSVAANSSSSAKPSSTSNSVRLVGYPQASSTIPNLALRQMPGQLHSPSATSVAPSSQRAASPTALPSSEPSSTTAEAAVAPQRVEDRNTTAAAATIEFARDLAFAEWRDPKLLLWPIVMVLASGHLELRRGHSTTDDAQQEPPRRARQLPVQ